ncbi:MAG TPA: cytochrome C oxidase subunit III [Thermoanaerobaculia bacterium]|nr:cytochrome C oxidase subunit III [Thermoanaerobaculia bacterium]
MSARRTIDVSRLPDISLTPSALFWWGTVGLILIEATTFVIMIATAIYLRLTVTDWPPPTIPPPDLRWGVAGLVLILASCLPLRAAEKIAARGHLEDTPRIRALLYVTIAITALFIAVRFFEFPGTHTKWNSSAYGSIVWTILGLHLLEGVAGFLENGVLAAVLKIGPVAHKQFLDVRGCAIFWYFIALGWIPLFLIVYVYPRLT